MLTIKTHLNMKRTARLLSAIIGTGSFCHLNCNSAKPYWAMQDDSSNNSTPEASFHILLFHASKIARWLS